MISYDGGSPVGWNGGVGGGGGRGRAPLGGRVLSGKRVAF